MFNRTELIELLLAEGADPTRRDITGLSALDLAQKLGAVDAALAPTRPTAGDTTVAPPRTTASALRRKGADALALVSVPGASATVEAMDQLLAMGMDEGMKAAMGQIDAILAA